ncbi:MAG: helix-turn-helix domain-containing protein [Tepidisphaeraceae bacterium]|jgi:transcriptional regulator with XRE-family HTH domain
MARVAHVYGRKLAAARNRLAITQRELGAAIGVSDETISRVERQETAGILAKHLPKLAVSLGMNLDQFRSAFCPPAAAPAPTGTLAGQGGLPPGIDVTRQRPARTLPEFAIGIAASRRVDKLADYPDANRLAATADRRAFSAPVDGDCQNPKWRDGEIVIFSYDAVEREGILPGSSYYVAFTDGSTTFKRLFPDEQDPEQFVLRCWNRKKYPNDQRVHRDEIVRIAKAVSKQVIVDESGE